MGSLNKKRDIWYYWTTIQGKKRGISLKTKSRSEAIRKAEKLEKDIRSGVFSFEQIHTDRIVLSQILDRWLEWNYERSARYKEDANRFWKELRSYLDNKSADSLKSGDFLRYLKHLRKSGHSDTYVGIRVRTIKAIFSWAKKKELIQANPILQIEIPKASSRQEYLSSSEIQRLLDASTGNPLYNAYLQFFLSTGCRRGEFYNLRWADINDHYITFTGKSGKRMFPLQPNIRKLLKDIKNYQKKPSEWVFVEYRTGLNPKRQETIGFIVKRYVRKAKLKDSYSTHTLRHTFASHLVMKGIPIYTVSKLMGHSKVKTTERYAHLAPERLNVDIEYF